jgi:hypothetical protein
MNSGYPKSKPRGSCNFRPGSNPSQKGLRTQMTQADSVLSTPPTNTSAIDHPMMFPPRDPTRRRFLTVAAVASVVSAGTPASVPQAVTVPQASRALRDAIRALDHAHANLTIAQAANEEAEAMWNDWERQHPQATSKRGRRR